MRPFSAVPYPRQDEIHADEDGMGFALRMATRNCITFHDLARHFASPGHLYLPAQSASAIAFMFGCTPAKLCHAFVQRQFRGCSVGAHFLGFDFLRPYHLRQTHPQLCPICIREQARALAIWSASLVTACPVHEIHLIEHCACGRPISWRRPSIDTCECGLHLTDAYQRTEQADPREVEVARQATYLLGTAHFRLHARDAILGVFDDVSIDTYLRLIWAFGIVEENQSTKPRSANRLLPTDEASMVCCRAHDRFAQLISTRSGRLDVNVHTNAFASLRLDYTSASDVRMIESIAGKLDERSGSMPRRRCRLTNPQLPLFGEADD
ncbi:TniQ family protein [Burkholderia diffusa]|uniref:TniQ family protein n=1 Tax=Burkholderia diffusa TaxID=488732 RepID=UPI00157AC7FA|nr:TniQ family protein [Burkholderia diffusa]NTY41464.1 hypothetical protein [Burkholderia diffusa]